MGRKYSVVGGDTNTAATTILGVNAKSSSPTVRGRLFDILVSSVATPADNAGEYYFQRITTAGTSTGVTPQALDSADGAAECVAGKAHSVEPTYTAGAILLDFAVNQRATFRWVAAPGSELVIPATANNGIGMLSNAIGGSAVAVLGTILYEE